MSIPRGVAGAFEEFLGVRTGRRRIRGARQHARQLDHPGLAVDRLHRGGRRVLGGRLGDPHLLVRVGSHLGQVGHHQNLGAVRHLGQRLPHFERRGAADAGIDLIEHHRVGASGEHQAQCQQHPRQLAPGRRPLDRCGFHAGVGGQREGHPIAGVIVADSDLQRGPWHGQGRQPGLNLSRQQRRRGAPGCAHLRRSFVSRLTGDGQLIIQFGRPSLPIAQLGQAGPTLLPKRHHLGQRVAVLAAQIPQLDPAPTDPLQPFRVLLDRLGLTAQFPCQVGQLRLLGQHPFERRCERLAVGQGPGHGPQRIREPALSVVGGQRQCGGLAMADRIGQQYLLDGQRFVFVRVVQARRIDLGDLEGQQVHLPNPGPLVASQLGQRRAQRTHGRLGFVQLGHIHVGPGIEGAPLHRRCGQRQLGPLGVDLQQARRGFGQLTGGDQRPVAIGAAAALSGYDTTQHQLLAVGGDEAALHDRLIGTGPHDRRIGPGARQQLEGAQQQGLAGAGLARQGGHVTAQVQAGLGDDAQVGDCQLVQHESTIVGLPRQRPGGGGPSAVPTVTRQQNLNGQPTRTCVSGRRETAVPRSG